MSQESGKALVIAFFPPIIWVTVEQAAFPHLYIKGGKLVFTLYPLLLYVSVIMEEEAKHIYETN